MALTETKYEPAWDCYNSCYWIPNRLTPEELFQLRMEARAETLAMIANISRAFRPILKAIQLARRLFERRSAPRWGAARWKAKT